MSKDRNALGALEMLLLVMLIGIVAVVIIILLPSGGETEIADIPDIPENALNVETYEFENITAGTIVRWEDPDYNVVCWTRLAGRTGGGVSCVPKSQLAPLGPTVIP